MKTLTTPEAIIQKGQLFDIEAPENAHILRDFQPKADDPAELNKVYEAPAYVGPSGDHPEGVAPAIAKPDKSVQEALTDLYLYLDEGTRYVANSGKDRFKKASIGKKIAMLGVLASVVTFPGTVDTYKEVAANSLGAAKNAVERVVHVDLGANEKYTPADLANMPAEFHHQIPGHYAIGVDEVHKDMNKNGWKATDDAYFAERDYIRNQIESNNPRNVDVVDVAAYEASLKNSNKNS